MDTRTSRLIEAFRDSGLSQTELCAKTGINKGAMSSYLSGRYFPKQQALEKLSVALNVSIYYLMGLDFADESSSSFSDVELLLISKFRDLNAEGQDRLLDYLNDLVASGRYIKSDSIGMVSEA